MGKLSVSIKACLVAMILVIPFCVGCGDSGGGTVPKADKAGPEPQRIQRGVQGAGAEGGAGAAPLGN